MLGDSLTDDATSEAGSDADLRAFDYHGGDSGKGGDADDGEVSYGDRDDDFNAADLDDGYDDDDDDDLASRGASSKGEPVRRH